MLQLKRVYEPPAGGDGYRILVDRRWPCGVFKQDAAIDQWLKEIAPSEALLQWFGRDPAKWEEFRQRYWTELRAHETLITRLEALIAQGTVTLIYRAKDPQHNSAVALAEYLEQRAARRARQSRRAA